MTDSATHALHDWTAAFASAFNAADTDGLAALFADGECYWRDLVAFSWNIVTVEGRDGVARLVREQAPRVGPITMAGTTETVSQGSLSRAGSISKPVRSAARRMSGCAPENAGRC